MDRWEAISKLYDFMPHHKPYLSRYVCKVCGRKYKTDNGMYQHIDNQHIKEINELRDKAIIDQL